MVLATDANEIPTLERPAERKALVIQVYVVRRHWRKIPLLIAYPPILPAPRYPPAPIIGGTAGNVEIPLENVEIPLAHRRWRRRLD
jgi:hypothetical protein